VLCILYSSWQNRSNIGTTPDLKGLKVQHGKLDLHKYQGKWYEHRRIDSWFERGLTSVTAEYKLNSNGFVDVINMGRNIDGGQLNISQGLARQCENSQVLLVSFFPFIEGPYVILYLPSDYSMVVIGSPDKKYLWLLTRQQQVTKFQLDIFYNSAIDNGYTALQLKHLIHSTTFN